MDLVGSDPELQAARGLDLLEQFRVGDPVRDMEVAIADLDAALDAAPHHADAPVWHYSLALALGQRAVESGVERDWHAAVDHMRIVWDVAGGDRESADEISPDFALLLFRRFHSLLARWDEDEIRARCIEVAGEMDGLGSTVPYVTMLRGLVSIDGYRIGGDPEDRDDGIALLEAAFPYLTDDELFVPEALGEYALALDDVAEETTGTFRDRAIEALRRALALLPAAEHPDLVLLDGELRTARGYDGDGDPDDIRDLRAGTARFAQFNDVADAEDTDRPFCRVMQARAHDRLWFLTKDPADLDAVIACADDALAIGLPEDLPLELHRLILQAVLNGLTTAEPDEAALRAARTRFSKAVAALDGMSYADAGSRAELAFAIAALGFGLFGVGPGLVDVTDLHRFAAIALRHPDPPYEWEARLSFLAPLRQLPGYEEPPPGQPRLPEPAKAWTGSNLATELGSGFAGLTAVMAFHDALRSGDRGLLRAARELLLRQPDDGTSFFDLYLALCDAAIAQQDGADAVVVAGALGRVCDIAERDEADPWVARYLLPTLRMMRAASTGATHVELTSPAPTTDVFGDFMAGFMGPMSTLAGIAGSGSAPDAVRRLLRSDEQRIEAVEPGSVPFQVAAMALGVGWLHLARQLPGDADAVDSAVRWCATAVQSLPGPEHPLWGERALDLGAAHRIRRSPGDLADSRAAGLSALRGHAWLALLQPGTDHAVATARTAAETASTVAGWCADDGAYDDLLAVVEAGRGLALHAATTTRSVAEMLGGLDRADLIEEWTAAAGRDRIALPGAVADVELDGDLRGRVMAALVAGEPAVLDPPGVARIRAALRSTDVDVLVYLVPGADGPGRAIFVPASDGLEVRELPGLDAGPHSELTGYAAAYGAWHMPASGRSGPEAAAAFARWSDALVRLTRWAWTAAAGDVLAVARRCTTAAVPRIVLIPVGMLALVPWHAAARPVGPDVRYLVEDAVVSYAASGQLLCEVVERPPIRGGATVVVGNPENNLRGAGLEAQAVHAAFHPDADYLGMVGSGPRNTWSTAPDGAATVEEVLERAADRTRPCGLLHLACHARADATTPTASHLRLSGGPLTVGALMDRDPTGPLPLGTVVLAACSTSVAGGHYDEAFSISTAFLAAGARTAIGSLWTVPDGYTSRLSFMLHHHLAAGLPAADAVRQAQLWMLDRYRDQPSSMPDMLLTAPIGAGGHEHPLNWAGLMHLGR